MVLIYAGVVVVVVFAVLGLSLHDTNLIYDNIMQICCITSRSKKIFYFQKKNFANDASAPSFMANFITGFTDGSLKRGIKQFSTKRSCTNNQLSLVIFGTNLTSTVSTVKFTKQVSNMIKLPYYQKSIIIGLLLSDG